MFFAQCDKKNGGIIDYRKKDFQGNREKFFPQSHKVHKENIYLHRNFSISKSSIFFC